MAKGNFRRIEDIMNNPVDRTALMNHIDEAVRCKQKIADENESIKGIVDAIKEKIAIEPKIFKALVNVSFKNNAAEKQHDLNALETAITALFSISEEDQNHDAE